MNTAGQVAKTSTEGDGDINFPLIKKWLSTCEQTHVACKRAEAGKAHNPSFKSQLNVEPLDILLIDVQQWCLVKATTRSRYLALSYVWGQVQQLKTNKGATHLFQRQALLSHIRDIPRTIRDAIRVTTSVGERYLWVDSLCIIDDDIGAKHHQISRMDEIYGGATATIIAATGEHAKSGLPGIRPNTRTGMSPYRFHSVFSDPMICRPVRPDRALRSLAESTYSTRGWTFQERLLSFRCLFFLKDQVYFQCKTELWCEDPQVLQSPFFHPSAEEYRKLTLNSLTLLSKWAIDIQDHKWDLAFTLYAQLVCEYSAKSFSYSADVLRAMAGILSQLEAHSGWTFHFGIPEPFLELCLFWAPYTTQTRRPTYQAQDDLFPTWSWSAWVGRVNFRQVYEQERKKLLTWISCIKNLSIGTRDESGNYEFRTVCRQIDFASPSLTKVETGKDTNESQTILTALDPAFLRFSASIVQTTYFHFETSLPWKYEDFPYIVPYETARQREGVIIKSQDQNAGFIYGVSLDYLSEFNRQSTFFVLISESPDAPGCVECSTQPKSYYELDDHLVVDFGEQGTKTRVQNNPYIPSDILILNILVVTEVQEGLYERIAVGQLNINAWRSAQPYDVEIILH